MMEFLVTDMGKGICLFLCYFLVIEQSYLTMFLLPSDLFYVEYTTGDEFK